MDSHLLCDGAVGVALLRQRTHLIVLGLARLPPRSRSIREAAIVPVAGQIIWYLGW